MLKAFEDLESGAIDISQATTLAKVSESIISGLKSELQYAILTNQKPCIPFYGNQSNELLEDLSSKKLLK